MEGFTLAFGLEGGVCHGRESMVAGMWQSQVVRACSILHGTSQEAECSSQKPGYPFKGLLLDLHQSAKLNVPESPQNSAIS